LAIGRNVFRDLFGWILFLGFFFFMSLLLWLELEVEKGSSVQLLLPNPTMEQTYWWAPYGWPWRRGEGAFDNGELSNGDLVGSSPDFQVRDDALSPANRGGEGKKSSISFLCRSGALRNGDTGGASNRSFDIDIFF
jgi:hypothetical protein